jgi:hypothetical protein
VSCITLLEPGGFGAFESLIAAECVHAAGMSVVAGAPAVPELTRSADVKLKK